MAKKSSVEKNNRRARTVQRFWGKRKALRAKVADLNLTEEDRQKAREALDKLPKNANPIRLRNRCQLTGRPRAYLRKFKISRLTFREMANQGLIPGLTKSSW